MLAPTAAGPVAAPADLKWKNMDWKAAVVPGTVATALQLPLEGDPELDDKDWWYRCEFTHSECEFSGGHRLRFGGLATVSQVWLNGVLIVSSRNMFRSYECDVSALLKAENELVLVFRGLGSERAAKRPRPRWKTALVDQQNLRWVRTSLLGRIPGWTPRLPAVGPWRVIELVPTPEKGARDIVIATGWDKNGAWIGVSATAIGAVDDLRLAVCGVEYALTKRDGDAGRWEGRFTVPKVEVWFPHTHGLPTLETVVLRVEASGQSVETAAFRVGFRSVEVDSTQGSVAFSVNGRRIFMRGACWTADDVRAVDGAAAQMLASLRRFRDAGGNLIRVGGTMVYPSEAFLDACDALGIMVWQDFMFANMDYPFTDAEFLAEVTVEVREFLARASRHPCLLAYCGGSEVEQQAAMMGLPPADWSGPFFASTLPENCASAHPGVPYFPSSPTGGALPFHTATGLTHYYGVGAYKRPLTDARRASVRFTSECLAFSNVPEPEMLESMLGTLIPPHHPAWKAGVPRDNGAGWDFEDVRDYYLRVLFGVDPVELRSADLERYYAVSRVVSGELMLRVFAEWRRKESTCNGGLVWFWKDLRPGAGWGLLDSEGRPKAAYWYARRAWASQAVYISDEGLDGVALHVHNESAETLAGSVEIELLKQGRHRAAFATRAVVISPFESETFSGEAMLGSFADITYAYRFGPPRHDVVVARLRGEDGKLIYEDAWLPHGMERVRLPTSELAASANIQPDGRVVLRLLSAVFVQAISFSVRGYEADDAYFSLCPGSPREVVFSPVGTPIAFKVHVGALNLDGTVTVRG